MYKLETVHDLPDWMKQFGSGHYNSAPVGFKEIDLQKYAPMATQYVPKYVESRQMLYYADGTALPRMIQGILIFFSNGKGIMEELYWDGKTYTPHYYMFGCDHEWGAELTEKDRWRIGPLGSHDHVYKCKECGYIEIHDSSD